MKRYCYIWLVSFCLFQTACNEHNTMTRDVEKVKVKTMKVGVSAQSDGMFFSGTVEGENTSQLSFPVMGTLQTLNVQPGEKVHKGQLLATIDPSSVKNAYDAAKATLVQAKDAYDRMKMLYEKGSLPEIKWIDVQSKLKQAQAMEEIARKNWRDCSLYAPYSGIIASKDAEVGQSVMPGVPVVSLVTGGKLRVKIAVPETEISRIAIGQKAAIYIPALDNGVVSGQVVEKGIQANPLTRSYEVKISLNDADKGIMPGMVTEVNVNKADTADCVIIPVTALQLDENNDYFVWINASGKASKRMVRCGEFTAYGVTILSGLEKGSELIVEGQHKVCEGTPVTL